METKSARRLPVPYRVDSIRRMGPETNDLRAMIHRLARLISVEDRIGDLNPAQTRALEYLARANRFSRAPSHVAEYLDTTRGTVSQTLKALERKGLITAGANPEDRRSVSYDLTVDGSNRAARQSAVAAALDNLSPAARTALDEGLRGALDAVVALRGSRSFGICGLCQHHESHPGGRRCLLLNEALAPPEAAQICYAQEPANT